MKSEDGGPVNSPTHAVTYSASSQAGVKIVLYLIHQLSPFKVCTAKLNTNMLRNVKFQEKSLKKSVLFTEKSF